MQPHDKTGFEWMPLENGTYSKEADKELLRKYQESLIDLSEELQPPEHFVFFDGVPVFSLGEFSLIIGKAKAGKTFAVSIMVAAAVGNTTILSKVYGNLPEGKRTVLCFDTEQGRYHVQRVAKRICKLIAHPYPENLRISGLRTFDPETRLKIIEAAIRTTPNVGLVVIDGVRDLVTSINDEAEATKINSLLLRWTQDYKIHILCVLHQNKGDNNARGHLGTEMLNKSEITISVAKDDKQKHLAVVDIEFCKDKTPEPFAFEVDAYGIPQLADSWQPKVPGEKTDKAALIPEETHKTALRIAFKHNPKPRHTELHTQLKLAFSSLNSPIGDTKAKEYLTLYKNKGWFEAHGKERAPNRYYTATQLLG